MVQRVNVRWAILVLCALLVVVLEVRNYDECENVGVRLKPIKPEQRGDLIIHITSTVRTMVFIGRSLISR